MLRSGVSCLSDSTRMEGAGLAAAVFEVGFEETVEVDE